MPRLIESHFVKRQPLEDFLYHAADGGKTVPLEKDIEFFAKQRCIALRNRGRIDPEDITDALRTRRLPGARAGSCASGSPATRSSGS